MLSKSGKVIEAWEAGRKSGRVGGRKFDKRQAAGEWLGVMSRLCIFQVRASAQL
jgi:hypothetical protein